MTDITPNVSQTALGAPTLRVLFSRDGSMWLVEIPEWRLFGQAVREDEIEAATRDLIGLTVGLDISVKTDSEGADQA